MKTNKRTVWFLTLLSLVAVITIFYMNKDTNKQFDGLKIFDDSKNSATENKNNEQTAVFAESYIFDTMRMEVRNERSQLKDQLVTKMNASDTSSAKNDAYTEIENLIKRDSMEALMEMQIKSLGYTDAFVRTDGGVVNVTVLSEDGHSNKQADEITYLVRSTWDVAKKVRVIFQEDS